VGKEKAHQTILGNENAVTFLGYAQFPCLYMHICSCVHMPFVRERETDEKVNPFFKKKKKKKENYFSLFRQD
jgi:hypothetical protein